MSIGIGVNPQGLLGIVRAVHANQPTEFDDSRVNVIKLAAVAHGQVEMQLLRYAGFGPRRRRQLLDLLERQARSPVHVVEVEPIAAHHVGLAFCWRFMTGPLHEAEQLSPELGAAASVGGIEDHLPQPRGH